MQMSYYAANPHYAAGDYSEQLIEKIERCNEEAGHYFSRATVPQTAAFHQAMRDLRGLDAPRYDRARAAAKAAFDASTVAARQLCDATFAELMETGEVSEALSYRWDELIVAGPLLQAAE